MLRARDRRRPLRMQDRPGTSGVDADGRPMSRKRFLIFDAYYGTTGDNLRYIRTLFRTARADGWQPMLVCPGEGALTEAIRAAGGDVTIGPQQPDLDRYGGSVLSAGLGGRLKVLWALIAYNLKLLDMLRTARPDVVQCHNVRSLLMIGVAARLLRIPAVLYVKVELSNPLLDRIAFLLARRVLFAAAALMPRRRPASYRVLPIGVDLAHVDRVLAARPEGVEPEDTREHLTFAYAGWLLPVNGVHVLIDAFERTTHHVSDVRLEIVGDSDDADYKQELHNLVAWQNLESRVAFHGWRDDLLDVLDRADVYVEPSFAGGVPRSLVEAMALGKPVIATTVGGMPETVEEGELGLLVGPNDSTVLAEAMYRMAADRKLRGAFGAKAAEAARAKFAIGVHLRALEACLDEVAGSKRPNGDAPQLGGAACREDPAG